MSQEDNTKVLPGKPPALAVAATEPGDSADTPAPQHPALLARGQLVGRYLIVDRLGAGGMGVVYAAYDAELDRRIAIKVLRVGDQPGRSSGRARLLREAQALARLSHPNVIAVHDVGSHDEGVFLAMDLVEGSNLRAWQAERRHGWRDIRDVYLEAGQGLIAAHEAGIVHRDFKPENVLVGRDGKVRVTDFGLARVGGEISNVPAEVEVGSISSLREESAPRGQLTQAGTILGTPQYMPPEQHAGQPADARADQFSFCVSLTEALYGEHPFKRTRVPDMVAAMRENRPRPPPQGVKAPAWLRRALLKGMQADPAQRHADMRALLRELGRDQGTRRRTTVALAAGLILGGAAVFGVTLARRQGSSASAACAAAGARLGGVWDVKARAELRRAFVATGVNYAEEAFEGTARALDAWAARWTASSRDACRATRVTGVQSEEMLDRRTACLDDRLGEARELVALLVHVDAEGVAAATRAAASLTSVEACDDLSGLLARGPTQGDPKLDVVRTSLNRAHALRHAGRFRDALDEAGLAAAAARGTPLAAEALWVRGALEGRLGKSKEAQESLISAAEAGLASGDEGTAIDAWIELIRVAGHDLNHFDEALSWARMARAAVSRGHRAGHRDAALHVELGLLYKDRGKYADARAELETALALRESSDGADDPNTISVLNALGTVALAEGKYADARPLFEKVLDRERRAYGPEHPALAAVWGNMGSVAYEQGHYDEALAAHRHALDLRLRALGPDHEEVATSYESVAIALEALGRQDEALELYGKALAIAEKRGAESLPVARTLGAMGGTYHKQGRFAEALAVNQRSLAIQEKVLGADHPEVGGVHGNLGLELKALGRLDEAMQEYERSREILTRALGAENPQVAIVWDNEGEVLRLLGRPHEALVAYQKSVAVLEKVLGKDHPVVADPMTGEGRTLIALGRAAEALAVLEPALAIREKDPSDAGNLAETRFATAQALVLVGRERPRALSLAEQAREVYAKAGAARAGMLKEVDTWLAAQKR